MPFRFVHTADVHLDSPLKSLALRDAALADRVAAATRGAFARTVDLCLAERVDALLIAGDLYDGGQTSMTTARFVADQFDRLHAAGVRTLIVRGNHDALSKVSRVLEPPPSVTVFGARGGTVRMEAGALAVAVHGLSFREAQAPESLLPRYPAPAPGAVNIGLMHTSLNGAPGHDVYAPCALGDLQAWGYAYWALGHLHARAEYPGAAHVVMPGMPQARDMGEAGAKSVTLGLIDDAGRVTTAARAVALADFARVTVDAGGAAWDGVLTRLRAAVRRAREAATAPDLVLRLTLAGAGSTAPRLLRDRDLLAEEAARAAEGVWIEGVEVGGAAPAAVGAGALADLAAILAADVLPAPGFAARAAAEAAALAAALPADLRTLFGAGEPDPALLQALAAEGTAAVLAALTPVDGEG
jgi:DNA repair exonuclease SbcCD nuclease subunit